MSEVIKVAGSVCGCISVDISASGGLIELSEGTTRDGPWIDISVRTWPLVVAAVERELARREAEAILYNRALTLDPNYDPDA